MADKKISILETTTRLLASEGTSVPTARIAKESGVSNGTLFNYFATKRVLLDCVYVTIKEEVAAHIFEESRNRLEPKEFLEHLWKSYIYWALDNTLKHKVLSTLKSSHALSEDAKDYLSNIFSVVQDKMIQGIETKNIREIPTDFICEFAVAQMDATINYITLNNCETEETEKIVDLAFSLHWNGIKYQ